MKLTFFGGANEVGASSTLIEIDGYRILVDAGIRMNHEDENDSRLPDFPDFDMVGLPDAVLITHAHTDHTGALPVPVLRNLWLAGVKVYYTAATKAITRVMLENSLKLMEREEQEEGKQPLYTRDDLDVFLHCMEKEVPWLEPIPICEGVTATWIPAGHILGAAMIYIQGKHESILMTGDVSATDQLTIPGIVVPKWCKQPDVMVMETTYGDRPHRVLRKHEEKRLALDVYKVIKDGGKVLIPAFAVGRSQEVILILKQAMESGQISKFPVYVDGMVRKVNAIYSDFADENLFYSDFIRVVKSRDKRDSILSGEPCCIVASSGMLVGGMSSYYAKHLAGDPKNLIALTGYQAEGTAGCALLDLAEAGESTDQMWKLNDNASVPVKCQLECYSLSAHADSKELMELVKKVSPRKLFLVHGNAKARGDLFKSVGKTLPSIYVERPQNGRTYRVRKKDGISRGRQLNSEKILSEVSAFLSKMGQKRLYSVLELAEIWFGTEALTPLVVRFFEWCLSLDGRFFERTSGNFFCLR